MNETKLKPSSTLVNVASGLFLFVVATYILKTLATLLQPLFIAVFLFYAAKPLTDSLIQRRVPSVLARLVPALLILMVLLGLIWMISVHVGEITQQFPLYKEKFQGIYIKAADTIATLIPNVGDHIHRIMLGGTIPLGPIEALVKTLFGNLFGLFSSTLLIIFFLIFIYSESNSLAARLERAFSHERAKKLLTIGKRINGGIIRYIYVKGIASVLVAGLSTLVMIFFQLDLSFLWGTLIFFGNFIPYIGSIIAVLFPILTGFVQFESMSALVVMTALLVLFQVFVSSYFEPKFAGKHLDLSPLVVLVSLGFWGWLWGIIGLLLSVPIMVSVKLFLENIPSTKPIAVMMSSLKPSPPNKPQPPTAT